MAKTKLPKSVLGIKVPKALRKSKSVDTLLKSPTGREILAGALVAGATAAASALARHRAGIVDLRESRWLRRAIRHSVGLLREIEPIDRLPHFSSALAARRAVRPLRPALSLRRS